MEAEMIYKFRPGSRIRGDAQRVGRELDRVRDVAGGLTASAVVNQAKVKGSLLHRYFTWNQTEAAERYREMQARQLIDSVVVVFRDEKGVDTKPVRAFVAVGPAEDRYQHVTVVLNDPTSRRAMLAQALAELRAFQAKYQNLTELTAVFEAVQKVAA